MPVQGGSLSLKQWYLCSSLTGPWGRGGGDGLVRSLAWLNHFEFAPPTSPCTRWRRVSLINSYNVALDRIDPSSVSLKQDPFIRLIEDAWHHSQVDPLIEALPQLIQAKVTVDIVNRAIKALVRASRLEPAESLFHQFMQSGGQPNLATFEALLTGLLKHGRIEKAEQLMRMVKELGVKSSATLHNRWISHWLAQGDLETARAQVKEMHSQSIVPTEATYRAFMHFFLRQGDFAAADRMRQFLLSQGAKLSVRFYSDSLRQLFKRQAMGEVEAILAEMQSLHILPDEECYAVMIEGWALHDRLDRVESLLAEMQSRGMRPTLSLYNRLLQAISPIAPGETLQRWLQRMHDEGLIFNAFTYAALLHGLLAQGKYAESVALLQRMLDANLSVPAEVYARMLQVCIEKDFRPAISLIREQMSRTETTMTPILFNLLLGHYLRRSDYGQVDGLLLEMHRRHAMVPNRHILCTLLSHFSDILDFDRVRQILRYLANANFELTPTVYNILMKTFYVQFKFQEGGSIQRVEGLLPQPPGEDKGIVQSPAGPFSLKTTKETISLERLRSQFEALFGVPFKPTVTLFNEVLYKLLATGRTVKAVECYEEMRASGIRPNLTTFSFLIKCALRMAQPERAKQYLREAKAMGLQPTTFQAALIFHAYCRLLDVEAAEQFLSECTRILRIKVNFVFYSSLIFAYNRREEYSQVFACFDRMQAAGFAADTETCNYVLTSLFEIGEYVEAARFFERMRQQGVRRNSYTYSILTVKYLMKNEPEAILELLRDSLLPGNIIDAIPFNRLMHYYHQQGHPELIVGAVEAMMECCVQFDNETMNYLSWVFFRTVSNPETRYFARRLLEKALVDYEEEEAKAFQPFIDRMLEEYRVCDDQESLSSLYGHLQRVPELRHKLTKISPDLMETIDKSVPATSAIEMAGVDIEADLQEISVIYDGLRTAPSTGKK